MNLFRFLRPKPTISDQEVNTGLRWLTWEGAVSLGFNSITTSGFLVESLPDEILAPGNNKEVGTMDG